MTAVPVPPQPAPSAEAAALAHFTDYFVRNYPGPNTIIGNPHWHAPKLFRAAQYAMEAAAPRPAQPAETGAEGCPKCIDGICPTAWECSFAPSMQPAPPEPSEGAAAWAISDQNGKRVQVTLDPDEALEYRPEIVTPLYARPSLDLTDDEIRAMFEVHAQSPAVKLSTHVHPSDTSGYWSTLTEVSWRAYLSAVRAVLDRLKTPTPTGDAR